MMKGASSDVDITLQRSGQLINICKTVQRTIGKLDEVIAVAWKREEISMNARSGGGCGELLVTQERKSPPQLLSSNKSSSANVPDFDVQLIPAAHSRSEML